MDQGNMMSRFLLCIGVTIHTEWSDQCIAAARAMSRSDTAMRVIFNGTPSRPVPDGVETEEHVALLGQEQGLWGRAYEMARECNADWCAIIHDDMLLKEPGWESRIEAAERVYRIGMAGWAGYADCVDHRRRATIGVAEEGPAILMDGCGIVFNMELFRTRGRFTVIEATCGFGDLEASLYTISQGWINWNLGLGSWHHPSDVTNARTAHRLPMLGEDELGVLYQSLFPIRLLNGAVIYGNGCGFSGRRDETPPPS